MKTVKGKITVTIGVMMLALFAMHATCEACVTFITQDTYIVDESGSVDL